MVRRALEPARVEGHEQGDPQGRARRVQGQRGGGRRQAHRALRVRLPLERRLGLGGSFAGRDSPLRLRRQGRLPGRDRCRFPISLGERRQLGHRFEERGRAHGRGHRPGRARARRLGRDDRDHGQRSRLHAARVRRLLRRPAARCAAASTSWATPTTRPRARPSIRFRIPMAILFPATPTPPTAPRSSAPAPRMPHTARTSRGSLRPTGVGTQPTARSSASLRAHSCWPTGSSAATAARTATSWCMPWSLRSRITRTS